jgi:succinate dehydrogenase / fumarate reductase, membrane anchor subunit
MSVGRTIWSSADTRRANRSRAAQPIPEHGGFERFMWYFMRISGLLLVFLVLGHMLIMHVLIELGGETLDFDFVARRYSVPFWRIYAGLMLVLALVHGVNGARIILGDYVRRGFIRTFLLVALLAVAGFLTLVGLLVVAFFDPSTAPRVGPFA